MSTGKVVLGVLAGVAAGALLGVLFAPDKGSATRKKIASKSNEYADALGDKFNGLVDDITRQFQAVREEAMRIAHNARPTAQEAEEEVMATSNRRARHS